MKTKRLLYYLDQLLDVSDFPDFPGAMNGLQVEAGESVERLAVAVDASEATIDDAAESGADLLIVHHGLFWGGPRTLTGRMYRKVSTLVRKGIGLYSVHLPLDAHPEVGNAAVLARELRLDPSTPFGRYEDETVGWTAAADTSLDALVERLEAAVDGPVHVIRGGPDRAERVAVVTGAGGSFIGEASREGVDTLVTGEGKHHEFIEATELGLNVLYGGHYATETWGVRALAHRVEEEFGVPWTFIDRPSGL